MIPKIIHQIWFNKSGLPHRYREMRDTWTRHHPEWKYMLWTTENLPGMANRHIFDQLTNYGARADLLRYEILYQYGGWYCDMDTTCFKPIDPALEGLELALVYENPPPKTSLIANCFMGACPLNPFIEALLRELPYSAFRHDWPVVGATGPAFVSRIAERMKVVATLPQPQFIPFLWNERHRAKERFPDAYAAHHWDMGWRDSDSKPNIS